MSQNIDWTTLEYSTTEEQTIGRWIDGKPIYRKVINIASPSSSNTDYALIDANLETPIYLGGFFITADSRRFPIPMTDSNDTYSVMFVNNNNYIRGRCAYGGGSSIVSAFVIVEYTKTTDQGGVLLTGL